MDVPPRVSLDKIVNKLKDSKCSGLNGHIQGNNTFTSISAKGQRGHWL